MKGLLFGMVIATIGCSEEAGSTVPGVGGGDESFTIDYRSGPSALLDLRVKADLRFSGKKTGVPRTLAAVGVGQAHQQFRGDGEQPIRVTLSTGAKLEEGETFDVSLQFSRANDGEKLDKGGSLTMGCSFLWTGPSYDVSIDGDCNVKQVDGGYSLTIVETWDEETKLTGTVTFSPVPNQAYAFTPGYGCPDDQICLSLDAKDYDAATGYCLPTSNLKSLASACTADCTSKLTIEAGGTKTCVCSSPCGRVDAGAGGPPPTCDPAYGCIDF